MPLNLDMTALRSFVAVADYGGVTRAAGFLNLTQSAVSMQLKRLEEALDVALFDRSRRQIALTATGEQLLSYARRMLALNDEVIARLTDPIHEGDIVLGVPHDIVAPTVPNVLRRFHAEYPRMRVNLMSSATLRLKEMFRKGEAQVILTTEDACDPGGETLVEKDLVWVGAPDGRAGLQRPLRIAFGSICNFRTSAIEALDAAGIDWEMSVDGNSMRTVEAIVAADLAVYAALRGHLPPGLGAVSETSGLPGLPAKKINLYGGDLHKSEPIRFLVDLLRQGYRAGSGDQHDLSGRSTAA